LRIDEIMVERGEVNKVINSKNTNYLGEGEVSFLKKNYGKKSIN
jgi:hypothetical protein